MTLEKIGGGAGNYMVQEIEVKNLKQCPFCGGTAELKLADSPFSCNKGDLALVARVHCTKCHCVSNAFCTGQMFAFGNKKGEYVTITQAKEKARDAWNKRKGGVGYVF